MAEALIAPDNSLGRSQESLLLLLSDQSGDQVYGCSKPLFDHIRSGFGLGCTLFGRFQL